MKTLLSAVAAVTLAAGPVLAAQGEQAPSAMKLADWPSSVALGGSLSAYHRNAHTALAYPGLYGLLDRQNASVSYTSLFAGSAFNSVGFVYPSLTRGTFAVGGYQLASAPAEARGEDGKPAGSFKEQEMLVRVGYGDYITPEFGWGLNVSNLKRTLGSQQNGFATIGVGTHYAFPRSVSLGLSVDNVVASKTGDTEDKLNTGTRLNASYPLWDDVIMVGADATLTPAFDFRFGMEYFLNKAFSLRLGRNKDSSGLGFALETGRCSVEYNLGLHALGSTHQLTLSTRFGGSRSEERGRVAGELYRRASKLASLGRYDDALKPLREAERYQRAPQDMKALRSGLEKLVDAAVPTLAGGGDAHALMRKGAGYLMAGRSEMARNAFLQVKNMDPHNLYIERLLTLTGWKEGLDDPKDAARGSLPAFVDVDPIKLKLFKTEEYFQKQQWDMALKECREILEINPREVMAYVRMGSVFYALGMKERARQAWTYVEKIDPSNPEVQKAVNFMRQSGLAAPAAAAPAVPARTLTSARAQPRAMVAQVDGGIR
jgi:tetratricopeptide (TPR) repeat protein